jgi:hypothetical protein
VGLSTTHISYGYADLHFDEIKHYLKRNEDPELTFRLAVWVIQIIGCHGKATNRRFSRVLTLKKMSGAEIKISMFFRHWQLECMAVVTSEIN